MNVLAGIARTSNRPQKLTTRRTPGGFICVMEVFVVYWRCMNKRNNKSGRSIYIWKDRTGNEYLRMYINGKIEALHRKIWRDVFGDIPDGMVIDHIDGDTFNNDICNLRAVTPKINQLNIKRTPMTNITKRKRVSSVAYEVCFKDTINNKRVVLYTKTHKTLAEAKKDRDRRLQELGYPLDRITYKI